MSSHRKMITALTLSLLIAGAGAIYVAASNTGGAENAQAPVAAPAQTVERAPLVGAAGPEPSKPNTSPVANAPEKWQTPSETMLKAPCIDPNEMLTHPMIVAEMRRLAPVLTYGAPFEVFRGLDRRAVHSMAIQGDSAAMVLLARMHLAASRGRTDEQVLAQAMLERSNGTTRAALPQVTTQTRDEQRALARDWFSQAALHGRMLALPELGRLEQRNGETVVSKGWITQQAFDALDPKISRQLTISDVYTAMADLLVPELFTGIAAKGLERQPAPEVIQPLALAAADQYLNALAENGQSLPEIVASAEVGTWAELERLVCRP